MAKLMLVGPFAKIELTFEEDSTIATCIEHTESDGRLSPPGNCAWSRCYDTLDDAAEYATDHADKGDPR